MMCNFCDTARCVICGEAAYVLIVLNSASEFSCEECMPVVTRRVKYQSVAHLN